MARLTLNWYWKSVYGVDMRYLVDCPEANAVKALTGRKTLLEADMDMLAVIGVDFAEVPQPR